MPLRCQVGSSEKTQMQQEKKKSSQGTLRGKSRSTHRTITDDKHSRGKEKRGRANCTDVCFEMDGLSLLMFNRTKKKREKGKESK
jgi:hypothetical protein